MGSRSQTIRLNCLSWAFGEIRDDVIRCLRQKTITMRHVLTCNVATILTTLAGAQGARPVTLAVTFNGCSTNPLTG